MRFDYLLALKKIYSEFSNRNDVFDILVNELGELESAIASFNLEAKEIILNKDETDECYRIMTIKDNEKVIGISLKRAKKEYNGEQFTLVKNIIPQNDQEKGIIISSLEKVITKDYTIFFASSKKIVNTNILYKISDEKTGIWIYDNMVINENEKLFQVTSIDFYKNFKEIEDNIREQKCILPNYVSKLEIDYSKVIEDAIAKIIFIDNNYRLNKSRIKCSIAPTYIPFFCDEVVFNKYEQIFKSMGEQMPVLPIDTSFIPIDKPAGNYLIKNVKIKKIGD